MKSGRDDGRSSPPGADPAEPRERAGAQALVSSLFAAWERGDTAPFFSALAEDLTWTVSGHTPISGCYRSKSEYLEKVYQPLLVVFAGPTECRVRRIVAAGATVVVEWHGRTPTRDRELYAQDYCWIIRVSDDCRTIREITGYFDTDRVNKLLAPSGPLAVGPASR
jgi:uncharacterized protein